jgi:hypothetical protein
MWLGAEVFRYQKLEVRERAQASWCDVHIVSFAMKMAGRGESQKLARHGTMVSLGANCLVQWRARVLGPRTKLSNHGPIHIAPVPRICGTGKRVGSIELLSRAYHCSCWVMFLLASSNNVSLASQEFDYFPATATWP